ncbi:MAG: DUF3421 domain-containing protein [Cohaesibacter sp.]|nr:DUF3421 domain-containing protein [Cohaesibacter sp.]
MQNRSKLSVFAALALPFASLALASSPAHAIKIEDPAHIQWIYLAGKAVPDSLYSAGKRADQIVRVCRVRHRKDFEIGYLKDSFCQIGGDGMSRPYSEYEVLIFAKQTAWQAAKRRQLPTNAQDVSAGTLRGDRTLYMCRITYEGAVTVGTINSEGYCITGYKTGELKSDEFDILVRK